MTFSSTRECMMAARARLHISNIHHAQPILTMTGQQLYIHIAAELRRSDGVAIPDDGNTRRI